MYNYYLISKRRQPSPNPSLFPRCDDVSHFPIFHAWVAQQFSSTVMSLTIVNVVSVFDRLRMSPSRVNFFHDKSSAVDFHWVYTAYYSNYNSGKDIPPVMSVVAYSGQGTHYSPAKNHALHPGLEQRRRGSSWKTILEIPLQIKSKFKVTRCQATSFGDQRIWKNGLTIK